MLDFHERFCMSAKEKKKLMETERRFSSAVLRDYISRIKDELDNDEYATSDGLVSLLMWNVVIKSISAKRDDYAVTNIRISDVYIYI